MTDKLETLASALAAFQRDLPRVAKSKTAHVKHKDGGSHKYTYAGLDDVSAAVLPKLGAVGLSWTTMPTLTEDHRFVLVYKLAHTSGDSMGGEYPLPQNGTAQDIGSAITYARRYALCSVVGVAPDEDDDGATAAHVDVAREPVFVPAPADQRMVADAFEDEIGKCKTPEKLTDVGKSVAKAVNSKDITKAQFDRLVLAGAIRRAELQEATA